MKTLVLANQKGGVGKSAVAVQFAYYLADVLKKRVLVIDFDHQRNTSKAIRTGGLATVSAITSSRLLTSKTDAASIEHFIATHRPAGRASSAAFRATGRCGGRFPSPPRRRAPRRNWAPGRRAG